MHISKTISLFHKKAKSFHSRDGGAQALPGAVQVDRRSAEAAVAQEFTYGLNIGTTLEEPDGGRVPERVRLQLARQTGQLPQNSQAGFDRPHTEPFPRMPWEQKTGRALADPGSERSYQCVVEGYDPILAIFALADKDRQARRQVDVLDFLIEHLRDAMTGVETKQNHRRIALGRVAPVRCVGFVDFRFGDCDNGDLLRLGEEIRQLEAATFSRRLRPSRIMKAKGFSGHGSEPPKLGRRPSLC